MKPKSETKTTRKSVLITGANRGIGAELARVHAAHGWHVYVGSRRTDRASDLVAEIRARGDSAEALEIDLADPTSIARAAAHVDAFGPLDRLINNAGTVVVGLFERQSPADIRAMFEINFFGPLDLTQRLLPAMIAVRKGHIVNHASMAYVGMPTHSTYGAVKAAVVALSDALRRELRGTGVKVTCLLTPIVATEMARTSFEGASQPGAFQLKLPSPACWLSPQKYAERLFRALARAPANYTMREGRLIVSLQRYAPWLLDFAVAKLFTRSETWRAIC